MGTWNTNYENIPRNKNNPGYGAPSIRELKSEITRRLQLEHFMGPTWENTDTYTSEVGYHREGSARVRVTDAFSIDADRDAALIKDTRVGRITMDLDDIATPRTYNGELEAGNPPAGKFDTTNTSVDDKNQIISVQAYDDAGGTLVAKKIFDATRFVDVKFDQSIDGRKTFDLAPKSELADNDGVAIAHLIQVLTGINAEDKKQLLALSIIKDSIDKIVEGILIGESSISTELDILKKELAGGSYRDGDGRIDETLKIKSLDAGSVKGAVWV